MARNTAYFGLMAAMAIMLGYLESMLPPPLPVPGVKLGLSNIVLVILLYQRDIRAAASVAAVKILLGGVLYAGVSGIIYSAAGAALSLIAMAVAKKTNCFSLIGVSVAGGVFHNVGQLVVAAAVVDNTKMFYYLPTLILSGTGAGLACGLVTAYVMLYIKKIKI